MDNYSLLCVERGESESSCESGVWSGTLIERWGQGSLRVGQYIYMEIIKLSSLRFTSNHSQSKEF
jgi:hypothetical protein